MAIKLIPPVGFMKSSDAASGSKSGRSKPAQEPEQKKRRKDTIFAQILSSGLPEDELSDERLIDEGVLRATAGSETTAWAITVTVYHLMQNPLVLKRAWNELSNVETPIGDVVASWPVLEKLPYLTAIIKEGLRLAGGVLSRLPRIYDKPIRYKQWIIPAGTPVAMTPHLILIDEKIFPNPRKFDPERWLDQSAENMGRQANVQADNIKTRQAYDRVWKG